MPDDLKERGIKASNRDFQRYDQVRKEQTYRLAESKEQDEFDAEFVIQTCDLSLFFDGGDAGREKFAEQLGRAMERIGFAILINHGIDTELYDFGVEATKRLFETTTREHREKYLAQRQGSVNQGYFPIEETTIIHPDLVEGWVFCRRAFDMDEDPDYREADFWPLTGLEPQFRKICLSQEKLIPPIMQSILRYLGCDPHLYDERLTGTNFGFRLNYYPPVMANDAARGGGRMLGHEDVDLFTFLPAPRVSGLQVLNRENMKWIRLDAPPGSIIMNTGDYMQRITNDRLPSTTHRVSRPDDPALCATARISLPMAIYVWEHEILEVLPGLGEPRYEPVKAITFHTRTTSKYYGDDYAVD
ncbi:MAG: 2-oxoglutarate and iron-dependent oxygenase domain-containing protein [Gammaproteobacteria bacterium]